MSYTEYGYKCEDCETFDCSDDPDACVHPEKETRGDYDYCMCCGTNLGEWRSNDEYHDQLGAPRYSDSQQ